MTSENKKADSEDGDDSDTGSQKLSLKGSGGNSGGGGTLSLSGAKAGDARRSLSQRGSRDVQVVRRRRVVHKPGEKPDPSTAAQGGPAAEGDSSLTTDERQKRLDALKKAEEQKNAPPPEEPKPALKKEAEDSVSKEGATNTTTEGKSPSKTGAAAASPTPPMPGEAAARKADTRTTSKADQERAAEEERRRKQNARRGEEERRSAGKLTLSQALSAEEEEERMRSLASVKRARAKRKQKIQQDMSTLKKQVREVIVPEAITVQELSNRMAVRSGEVIKTLMNLGIMAKVTQTIEADTAELVIEEFGHKIKRVSESDVEIGLEGAEDKPEDMEPRAPVVTVMGHVDHGKTSLLDALKQTDVVAKEAGGITQHIGAYKVTPKNGNPICFIDTPGHEAFTEMRSRGATVTDIVILVVAADDGIMPQTVEAIQHARAAKVPMIVAINKIDKPDADPMRVRTELLNHEVVVEEMSGDVLSVEVSALQKQGLDKLEEAIQLQAELMELKANPNRAAQGTVIEAKLEQGRGAVATVLVQKGTLKTGDLFVAGATWGKVRALQNDKGQDIKTAGPSEPVEVLGLNEAPQAGDDFAVLESEARAREIVEFRQRQMKKQQGGTASASSLDQLFSQMKKGQTKEFPLILKTDVHGSMEAIKGSLEKLNTGEIKFNIISTAVGGITESDVNLANTTGALIVAFNVRANKMARELAEKEGIDIKYYSIIYDVVEDSKALLSGMLAPTIQEDFIGYAEIREVFNITKVGKVAGCFIKEGVVKRGSGVRLLRDNVVIYEGKLKTLKRFKEEVKEVKEGYECGMAFESYDDVKAGDVIECFEKTEVARTLDDVAAAEASQKSADSKDSKGS